MWVYILPRTVLCWCSHTYTHTIHVLLYNPDREQRRKAHKAANSTTQWIVCVCRTVRITGLRFIRKFLHATNVSLRTTNRCPFLDVSLAAWMRMRRICMRINGHPIRYPVDWGPSTLPLLFYSVLRLQNLYGILSPGRMKSIDLFRWYVVPWYPNIYEWPV